MEGPVTWLIIILVVLVIAAAVWMLLRRRADSGAADGARHQPDAPQREDEARGDTTAAATPTAPEHSAQAPSDRQSPETPREPTYTDTATGAQVPAEDDHDQHVAHLSPEPAGRDATGRDSEHDGGITGVAPAGTAEPAAAVEREPAGAHRRDPEPDHTSADSQAPVTDEAPAPDHPGPAPHETPTQPVQPVEPHRPSEPVEPVQPTAPQQPEPAHPEEPRSEEVPPPPPYGPGSATPGPDGSGPDGWVVKGNTGSMLFHTPDSPSYDGTSADVWFESEEVARTAGFAHWDRKRR